MLFFFNIFCLSKKKSKRCERTPPIISNLELQIWAHRPSTKGTKPLFISNKSNHHHHNTVCWKANTAKLRRCEALALCCLPLLGAIYLRHATPSVREPCLLATAACLLPPAATAYYICSWDDLLPPLALQKPGPGSLEFGGHPGESLSYQTLAGLVAL